MYRVIRADKEDIDLLLSIKRKAFMQQAKLYNTTKLPALLETRDDFLKNFDSQVILKAVTPDNTIIGSIRIKEEGGAGYIGSLVVLPDFQRKGIGELLLLSAEEYVSGAVKRFELFTGEKSFNNIKLYSKNGYKEFCRKDKGLGFDFVYMEKAREIISEK
jgi:ribosomal protein S18 acetylase RimI-like enzyme